MSSFNTEFEVKPEINASQVETNCCIEWVLDSGCSDHVVNNDKYFYESVELKEPVNVKVADGRYLKATKIGNILHTFNVYGQRKPDKMENVFFVKDMDRNLLSYGKVTKVNRIVSVGNTSKVFDSYGNLVALAVKHNNISHMSSEIIQSEINLVTKSRLTEKEKLHRTLGHVNFSYLKEMCNKQMLEGLPNELESDYLKCGICIQNKMHNLAFTNERTRAKEILEIVHTDSNGPHATTGLNGEKYFLTFIDDYSKVAKVYCIKSKSEVYNCFVDYVNLMESKIGKKIKRI